MAVQNQLKQIVLKTLSQEYSAQNRTGRVAQVVEHLPSKCEALSSNPRTSKKKKKEEEKLKINIFKFIITT
jgi:hypothetical protein